MAFASRGFPLRSGHALWYMRQEEKARRESAVAFLTSAELSEAVEILSAELGFGKLCERFARLGAFVSRRRPASTRQLSERLYALTGGLRREAPPTYAFHAVWSESISARLGKEGEEKLEEIAKRINACLTPRDSIEEGKRAQLEEALDEYQRHLAAAAGERAARIDMLLKAVPEVAEVVRTRFASTPNREESEN